jgi:hypothetical protein
MVLYGLVVSVVCTGWGFFGHRQINSHAVFLLPPEVSGFYKHHMEYVRESAVNPDRRRYAVKGEAARHYIDLDRYKGKYLPETWEEAVLCYGVDSLDAHGVLPWNLMLTLGSLRNAFLVGDPERILKVSADLGHYVGDAHVPLHTTSNYDGQQTGQHGLHGFWESRLPELYFGDYDFLIGKAEYVEDPRARIWSLIMQSHTMVDSVLDLERKLYAVMGEAKFGFESRSGMTVKAVTPEYSRKYHVMLNGMVERQMRRSVKCVADLWYTAWVDGGQPDMDSVKNAEFSQEVLAGRRNDLKTWRERNFKVREHETEGF